MLLSLLLMQSKRQYRSDYLVMADYRFKKEATSEG